MDASSLHPEPAPVPDGTHLDKTSARAEMTSVRTKLLYGFGSVAYGVKDQGFSYFLLFFYNQVIGLSAVTTSTAIAVALACDAFVDILIGEFSDNLRTRWGRRHPLMYCSAIPLSLTYWFLWNPPRWPNEKLFWYLVAIAVLVRSLISLYEVPSSALVAELTHDYDERTSMLGYRYFFGWTGGLSMTMLGFGVFFHASPRFPQGQLDPANYPAYALTACVVMVVVIFVSAFGTQKFVPYFSMPPDRKLTLWGVLTEMWDSMKNRSFLVVTLTALFSSAAAGVVTNLNFYFSTFFWELTAREIFLLTAVLVPGPLVAMFLAPYLGKRFGKREAALGLWAISMVVNWAPISLRLFKLFPENHSPTLLPTLMVFGLFGNILAVTCAIIVSSMLADVVEDSQLRTGRRAEGLFFAANSFVAKSVSGLGGLIGGVILTLVRFPAHASLGNIDPSVIRHLALVYVPTVVSMYLLAMGTVAFYSITRGSHEDALAELKIAGAKE
jgi:glycoside/pentoside/hexuronide:cation symporter, GPH family